MNRSQPFPFRKTLLVAAGLALLSGCSKKEPDVLPPAPEGANYGNPVPPPPPPMSSAAPGSQADFIASVMSDRVFFDTDQFNIDADDQQILQSQAQWIARYPGVTVVIEGHADERGTRDYNLALGERRANAAKNYLATLGVDSSRIRTISYGKERPQALGSDEASWAQNRRAVSVTIAPR